MLQVSESSTSEVQKRYTFKGQLMAYWPQRLKLDSHIDTSTYVPYPTVIRVFATNFLRFPTPVLDKLVWVFSRERASALSLHTGMRTSLWRLLFIVCALTSIVAQEGEVEPEEWIESFDKASGKM